MESQTTTLPDYFDADWMDTLTFRERNILFLTSQGLSCKQIADHLHITIETVKKHRKNLARKMGVSGKIALRIKIAKLHI